MRLALIAAPAADGLYSDNHQCRASRYAVATSLAAP